MTKKNIRVMACHDKVWTFEELHRRIAGVVENPGPEEQKFVAWLKQEIEQGLKYFHVSLKSTTQYFFDKMAERAEGTPAVPPPPVVGEEREALFAGLNKINELVATGQYVNVTDKVL